MVTYLLFKKQQKYVSFLFNFVEDE